MGKLTGKRIAVLVADGFEQVELTGPVERLKEEDADVKVVSLHSGKVKAWNMTDWGEEFDVDATVEEVATEQFDALLLPGGVMNPDLLRVNRAAVALARKFFDDGKPIAAICHGPWTLVEAGVVHGRTMTSWPSIRSDIMNAGGMWIDEEVVVDQGIVTSRGPQDLAAFNEKMVEEFAEGEHRRDEAATRINSGSLTA